MKKLFYLFLLITALTGLSNLAFADNGVITIYNPAAGVTWVRGETYSITFYYNHPEYNVKIELLRAGYPDLLLVNDLDVPLGGNGSYTWTISGTQAPDNYQIKITSMHNPGTRTTTGFFTISASAPGQVITVYNPAAGVTWVQGTMYNVTWTQTSGVAPVKVELYDDWGGVLENPIVAGTTTGTTCTFNPSTYPVGDRYKIKVTSLANDQVYGWSGVFTIAASAPNSYITVYNPASGVTWINGQNYNVTWTDNLPGTEHVRIDLFKNYGADSVKQLATGILASADTWTWSGISESVRNDYRIKITSVEHPSIYAWSGYFIISSTTPGGAITVYNPAAGVTWVKGTVYNITWTLSGISGDVTVGLYDNWGSVLEYAFPGTYTTTCSFDPLTLGIPVGDRYKIKVTSVTNPSIVGESGVFTISDYNPNSYITVYNPAAGVTWIKGQNYNITWNDNLPAGEFVRIDLFKNYGADSVKQLANNVLASADTWAWLSTNLETVGNDYKIKITSVLHPSVYAWSGYFIISASAPGGAITVYNPAAGVTWVKGTIYDITWTKSNITGDVTVGLYDNWGGVLEYAFSGTFTGTTCTFDPGTLGIPIGDRYKIKVTSVDNPSVVGESGVFTITDYNPNSYITVYNPAAGVTWIQGQNYNITWQDNIPDGENVRIDLFKNYGADSVRQLTAGTPANGTFAWNAISDVAGNEYKIKITSVDHPAIYAWSGYFKIAANATGGEFVKINSPAAGVTWVKGTNYSISWEDNIAGNLDIELWDLYGSHRVDLIATTNGGTCSLTTSIYPARDDYKIKIFKNGDPNTVLAETYFILSNYDPSSVITIWKPEAGVTLAWNAPYEINWWTNITVPVKIELYNNYGATQVDVLTATTSGSTFSFTANYPARDDYKIKISSTTDPDKVFTWSSYFKISNIVPGEIITVYSPAAGVTWYEDDTYNITWVDNISDNVDIELYKDWGTTKVEGMGLVLPTNIPSNGTASFHIPASPPFATGNDFKIKIVSTTRPEMVGWSSTFNISLNGKKSVDPDSQNPDALSVNVYPNPASVNLNISSKQTMNRIWVMNNLGNTVLEAVANSTQAQLDISRLNTGLYFIKIETEGTMTIRKFLKQ